MDYTIHWLPIVAVIIVNLTLGMVWYSPKNALGRYWLKHCKIDMGAGAAEGQEKEMRKMVMKSVGIQVIVTGVEAVLSPATNEAEPGSVVIFGGAVMLIVSVRAALVFVPSLVAKEIVRLP